MTTSVIVEWGSGSEEDRMHTGIRLSLRGSTGGENSGGGMTSIVMVAVELFGVGGMFDSDWLLFEIV